MLPSLSCFTSHLEPIDCTTIDQRWELPQPITESVSNRTHSQDNMELISTSLDEHVKQSHRCAVSLSGLVSLTIQLTHFLNNFSFLVSGEKIWDLTSIEKIVDVF